MPAPHHRSWNALPSTEFRPSEIGPDAPRALGLLLTVVVGVANAAAIVPVNAEGVAAAPVARAGLAAGILVMSRYLGAVVGVAVVGELLEGAPSDDFAAGLSAGTKVTAAVGLAGAFAAARTLRGPSGAGGDGRPHHLIRLYRGQSPHG